MKDSYIVRNMTETDINLGEIRCVIKMGKTVDIMKITPNITMEKLKEQEKIGTLGYRLKKKQLIKVTPKQNVKEKMKVLGRPTVFEEKSENIVFPNKVKRGIVMEENEGLLETEILKDEQENEQDEQENEQEEIAPQTFDSKVDEKWSSRPIVMKEEAEEEVEEEIDEATIGSKVAVDKGVISVVSNEEEDDLRMVESLVKKFEASEKKEAKLPVSNTPGPKVVSANQFLAVVPGDDESPSSESRPLSIKASRNNDSPKIPLTQKQQAEQSATEVAKSEAEPEEDDGRCVALNRFGKRCRNRAKAGMRYCGVHKKQAESENS